MEHPEGWDLLTGSLSASDLQQPRAAWAFLVVQGLVRDLPEDRERFCQIVAEVLERGPITGPSMPATIAGGLRREGLALPLSELPDPDGERAQQRHDLLATWRQPPALSGEAVTRRDLSEPADKRPTDLLPLYCVFCGAPDTDQQRDGVCHHCQRRLPESQSATRGQTCPHCSEINLLIATFCMVCGQRLQNDACEQCGKELGLHDVFCTNCGAHVTGKSLTEPIAPPPTAPAALTTSRLFRLFAQPADSGQLTQQVGDLRAVLLSVIQDVAVLKEVLHEQALWDDAQYKRLRVHRMIADQSSASASPWMAYSYYPYTLEDEQFLRLCLHADETEIEEFKREVEQTKELT